MGVSEARTGIVRSNERRAPNYVHDGTSVSAGHTLIFDGVSKFFGIRKNSQGDAGIMVALKDVRATVQPGEFVTLLGPSGCGKTTLLRMTAGLLKPDEGTITIGNVAVREPRKDACMVFQNFGLLPWRTVARNIEFPLELDGVGKGERAERAFHFLDLLGLSGFESHYPHELSGGMQQRVGIARAMMRQPILIFMDEPFGALDAQTREQLQEDFLKIWQQTRMTVLFVTHSIDEALCLSDRIFVFSSRPGRLSSIIDSPLAPYRMTDDVRTLPEFAPCRAKLRKLLQPAH
ncbi:MAG: ABC transporter ATP-binding protein [Xanthobacteraceae bacterium]